MISEQTADTPIITVDVLGVHVACVGTPQILHQVTIWAHQHDLRTIFYVNAHCLNVAYTHARYQQVLNQADLVYPDGISVVWAGRLLGGCRMQKATGADWIAPFCALAVQQQWRLYVLAGKPGIARQACSRLMQQWPGLNIVGMCDGFFHEKTEQEVLDDIRRTHPHVLFVGMGIPRQEIWLASHRHHIKTPVCWAVGALFDYVAGVEPRVPTWMNQLALEWLWRLIVDPTGKWRRYLIGNPLFVARIWHQKQLSRRH
ncbi:MAG: WecB/TagA/CpsF family glycosyltransferase [Chloroflexaceae bacterium]|nr:WecB/TagA/CpsF family glycosyltransferase [Chloroflexaceae bacterium]